MQYENFSKEYLNKIEKNIDDKFTNKEELEYPSENDFVDIKVLNNNTKLLDNKKADISSVETALQGLAKERSEYSIEDKVKELDKKFQMFEETERKRNWLSLPNLKTEIYNKSNSNSSFTEAELLNVIGGGHLIIGIARFTYNASSPYNPKKMQFKIQVDDEIIYDASIVDNYESTGWSRFWQLGITNDTKYTSLTTIEPYKDVNNNKKTYKTLDTYWDLTGGSNKKYDPFKLIYGVPLISLPVKNKTFNVNDYGDKQMVGQNVSPIGVAISKEPIRFNNSLKIIAAHDATVQVYANLIYSLDD